MEEEEEKSRCKEQDVHLHGHSQADQNIVLLLWLPAHQPRQLLEWSQPPSPGLSSLPHTAHRGEQPLPCSPEEEAAPGPALLQEEVDGEEEDGHGNGVIKEPQDKDGVDAVGGTAHEEENVWGDLAGDRETRGWSAACPGRPAAAQLLQTSAPRRCARVRAQQSRRGPGAAPGAPGYLVGSAVDAEDEEKVEEVEASEDVLRQADVGAAARGIVQAQEDVHEAGGVTAERRE